MKRPQPNISSGRIERACFSSAWSPDASSAYTCGLMPEPLHAPVVGRLLARAGQRLLTGIAAAAAVVVIFQFVQVALARIPYPFDLEWMEGGIIGHVRRVMAGRNLYGPPSLEFTPFIYPPFYYYVSALASSILGSGYFAPRLVSLLSILGSFVVIGHWVRRESGDALAGLVAAAVFCACYGVAEYWYDVARVDSLFLLLLLGGLSLLRSAASSRQAALAGVLLALSCFTKQSALPYALGGVALLLLRAPRLFLIAAASLGGLLVFGTLLLNASSHGYFWYYVVEMPAQHEVEWPRWREAFQQYLWTPAAPMLAAALALLTGAGFRSSARWAWSFNALFMVVAGGMSMTSLLKTGGYVNALIPAYAAFSIAFGIELAALRRAMGFSLGSLGASAFVTAVLLGQLALLGYDQSAEPPDLGRGLRSARPTPEDYAAGAHMSARLAALPEPLWVTASSEYSRVNGKPGGITHNMGVVDVMKAGGPRGAAVHAAIVQAIQARTFRCIVLDRAAGFLTLDLHELIVQNYQRAGSLMDKEPNTAFWPRSGAWLRPDEIWIAR
jgi:hypothetical protein